MEINDKNVLKIAHLARLHLDENEIQLHKEKLNEILELVKQLSSVDTENIEPLYHPLDEMTQPTRTDTITEQNERDEIIELSEEHKSGLYLVPKVIE